MNLTSYQIPGLALTDHDFQAPLDHAQPQGEQIHIFAREVVALDKASANLPWLVFLQGGPGYAAPRPDSAKARGGDPRQCGAGSGFRPKAACRCHPHRA